MTVPKVLTGRLNANSSLGQIKLNPGGYPCLGVVEGQILEKGTNVTVIARPMFAVDQRNQTIQIIKVRLQVGRLILRDVWIPVSKLEIL